VSLLNVAVLAAGLCAGEPAPAVSANFDVHVRLERRELEARATYQVPAGPLELHWHPAVRDMEAMLDGRPLEIAAHGAQLELTRPARLELRWQLGLAVLDTSLDHRDALSADRPMAGAGFGWLPAASAWYPQPATGFAGYQITVTSDGGEVVTAGELVAAEPVPGATRRRFEHSHPVSGIDLLIGPWQVRTRPVSLASGTQVEVATYFTDAVAALSPAYLESAARQLKSYDSFIGDYPYRRFVIVASPLPVGFGMPAMTWLGEQVLRLPFIPETSLRHEVLHNWWGNGVQVDYPSGNWSEGLTTLMADFATREAESPEAAAAQRLDWLRALLAVPAGEAVALRDFRSRQHGRLAAVGYGKAAFVLWMLRERIGEAAWQTGLRAFWSACRGRPASWADLQAAFELSTGHSLAAAFHPWLDAQDLPHPRIAKARRSVDGRWLELELAQNAPPYRLDLPVSVRTTQGVEEHRVVLEEARAVVRLATAAAALGVTLDPGLSVLRAPAPGALPPILRNALLARHPAWTSLEAGGDWHGASTALATAFFERPAARIEPGAVLPPAVDAHLLVGKRGAVATAARTLGVFEQRPDGLDAPGEAGVWTARAPDSPVTLVFVEAKTPATVANLARPLPHYGASAWLLISEGRATVRGAGHLDEPEFAVVAAGSVDEVVEPTR
jgi:hypothetical protein